VDAKPARKKHSFVAISPLGRYSFRFWHEAKLDEGAMWLIAFALKDLNATKEAMIGALVKKAVT
jgi:hypothetical protein